MRSALLPVFILGFALGCSQSQEPAASGLSVSQPSSEDIDWLRSGEHDAELVGKWKGTKDTHWAVSFVEDGSFEVLIHDQTYNKGHWRTEQGQLYFMLLWLDDPPFTVQSCAYTFDDKGNAVFSPDMFGGSGSSGYRKIG